MKRFKLSAPCPSPDSRDRNQRPGSIWTPILPWGVHLRQGNNLDATPIETRAIAPRIGDLDGQNQGGGGITRLDYLDSDSTQENLANLTVRSRAVDGVSL